jgi:hypothetical protein
MAIATLSMSVDFDIVDKKLEFEPLGLIYILYTFIWGLGIYL